MIVDHSSRIEESGKDKKRIEIEEKFMPLELTYQQKRKLRIEAKLHIWDYPLIFRRGAGQIIRRCILETEQAEIQMSCIIVWMSLCRR